MQHPSLHTKPSVSVDPAPTPFRSACCPPDGGKRAIIDALLGSVAAVESPTQRQAGKPLTRDSRKMTHHVRPPRSAPRSAPNSRPPRSAPATPTPTASSGTSRGKSIGVSTGTRTNPAADPRHPTRDTDSVSRGSLTLTTSSGLDSPLIPLRPLEIELELGRKESTPGREGSPGGGGGLRQPAFPATPTAGQRAPPITPPPLSFTAAAAAQNSDQAEITSLSRQIRSLGAELAGARQARDEATEDAMDVEAKLQRERRVHRSTKLQRNEARNQAWELEQQRTQLTSGADASAEAMRGLDHTLLLLESSSLVLVQHAQERAEQKVLALDEALGAVTAERDSLVEANDDYDRTLIEFDEAFAAMAATIEEKVRG